MPSFKGFGGILGLFDNLIFAHCFVVLQRLPNLWRRRPKDRILKVSRKSNDGSLNQFHVQAHAEFSLVLNSADLWVFGCVFCKSLVFSVEYFISVWFAATF